MFEILQTYFKTHKIQSYTHTLTHAQPYQRSTFFLPKIYPKLRQIGAVQGQLHTLTVVSCVSHTRLFVPTGGVCEGGSGRAGDHVQGQQASAGSLPDTTHWPPLSAG